MFNKKLECLDCSFSGRAARELTYCPNCQSPNILTMSNRQLRDRRKRQDAALVKIVDALVLGDTVIKDTFSKLSRL